MYGGDSFLAHFYLKPLNPPLGFPSTQRASASITVVLGIESLGNEKLWLNIQVQDYLEKPYLSL